jgi:hypothetical protein
MVNGAYPQGDDPWSALAVRAGINADLNAHLEMGRKLVVAMLDDLKDIYADEQHAVTYTQGLHFSLISLLGSSDARLQLLMQADEQKTEQITALEGRIAELEDLVTKP